MEFVSQGLLNVKGMITDRYDIKDIIKAFENAKAAKGLKHVITF
jgi:L-iditol 2-dehydrogenase